MKQSIQLNKQIAKERGEAGLLQAIAHAEAIIPDWADKAYKEFKKWLGRKPAGYRFQIEDFRLRMQISGAIPLPPSARSFGGMAVRAKNEKLIRSRGPKPTKSVTAHSCYSNEWQKI
jgi:hypothetical protein